MTTDNIARILATNASRSELSREARRQITGRFNRTRPIDESLDKAHARAQVALEAKRQAEYAHQDPTNLPYDTCSAFTDDIQKIAEEVQSALAGVRQ